MYCTLYICQFARRAFVFYVDLKNFPCNFLLCPHNLTVKSDEEVKSDLLSGLQAQAIKVNHELTAAHLAYIV